MNKIQMHANRNLRPRILSTGEPRGLKGYYSFAHDSYPTWWTTQLKAEFPGAFGAYENLHRSREQALVISPECIYVLENRGCKARIAYADIDNFDKLTKDPIPEAICIQLTNGKDAFIPILGKTGAIVDWLRFLQNAVDASPDAQAPQP